MKIASFLLFSRDNVQKTSALGFQDMDAAAMFARSNYPFLEGIKAFK
jgi:hypothetical protein